MTLDCPKCSARYNIQDSLIPATGARVKCKKCATVITIPAPVMELAPQDLELIPPAEPAAPSPRAPSRSFDSPAPSPKAPAPRSTPPASPAPPPLEEPAPFEHGFGEKSEHEPAAAEGIEVDRPFENAANLPPADPEFERASAPPRFGSPPPFGESPASPSKAREPLPGIDTSLAMSEPAVAAEERPAPVAKSTAAKPAAAPRAAAPSAAPETDPRSLAAAGTPIPAGLSTEDRAKHEKARRLARVLASDIAIYNRDKKDRGIKEGNLVAMLGYEIKKSWEVYKDRVGAEFANSTPYFRDALNEMLAEGKKIF